MVDLANGIAEFERLAAFAADYDIRSAPELIQSAAKACLLYGLSVGVASVKVRQVAVAVEALDLDSPIVQGGPSTRLLDGRQRSLGDAAMANAVLLSSRVQGDSHRTGHLGGVVIPSALALAQSRNLSGSELLSCIVAGYETALRIGRDHAASATQRGFRATPCYGVFAAAATAGRAFGFNRTQMLSALSIATNLSSGLREYVNAGTDESPFQAGFATRNGITAALLAKSGQDAAPSALHGTAGFFTTFGGHDSDHGARLVEGLGRDYELTTLTYKTYPACQYLRGMIRLICATRLKAADAKLASLEVRLSPFEANFVGVRLTGPFVSSAQTVMSAPFCAALAWATGSVGYYGLRQFEDPAVLTLAPRVSIVADETCKRFQTHIRVALTDGRILDASDYSGDADYQLDWPAATNMTAALFEEVNGDPTDIIAAADAVDQAPDVGSVIKATRAAIERTKGLRDKV